MWTGQQKRIYCGDGRATLRRWNFRSRAGRTELPGNGVGLHRRSQGVQWVHLQPLRAVEYLFQAYFTGKMCKCTPGHEVHPPARAKSQFLGQFLLGGLDLEVYLDGLWRRRLEKGRQLFWQERVHPQTKSWLRLCGARGVKRPHHGVKGSHW